MTDITIKMTTDLEAKNVIVIGHKAGKYGGEEPVVVYTSRFKGKDYFHIRSVYQDRDDRWCPGKGLTIDPTEAKDLLKGFGLAADHI